MRKLLIALLTALIALPAFAQVRSSAELITVTVVEVPVTVSDRNGNPVRDLTAANFELLDEGKKVPITHFEMIDLTRVSAAEPVNPAARRNFLLLFDLGNSTPGMTLRARDVAKAFVEKGLLPFDLVAVATYSPEKGLRLLTNFTNDKQFLSSAIDTLGHQKLFQISDPLLLVGKQLGTLSGDASGAGARLDTPRIIAEELQELNRQIEQGNDEYQRGRVRSQLKNFAAFARVLDKVKGRKQVILLSEGFDPKHIQGQAAGFDRADSEASITGEIWTIDSDQRFGSTEVGAEISEMAQLFRRSDVVLHAIDIRGLRSDVDPNVGYRRWSTDSLFLLSNPTGGQLFKNANDLGENFRRLSRQQEVVYVLGFQARPSGSPGKFHNLKVRIVNAPSGRLSHRAGYYEPSDKLSALEQTLTVGDILMSDLPRNETGLSLFAAGFPMAKDKAVVPVLIEAPGDKVMRNLTGGELNAQLYVYAFDSSNRVHDFLHQRISLDLNKVGSELRNKGLKFYGSLRLDPGIYAIKALTRIEETGEIGFQRIDVSIPQSGEVAILPPMIWEDEGRWIMIRGRPRSAAEVEYPFHLAKENFVPAAHARLSSLSSYKVALFTFGIPHQGLGLNAKVRSSSGSATPAKVSLQGVAPADASGATKLLLNFDPAGLAAGSYWLDLDVTHPQQNVSRTVSVPFEIRASGP